jgi:hypothetical protein
MLSIRQELEKPETERSPQYQYFATGGKLLLLLLLFIYLLLFFFSTDLSM